MIEKSNFKWLGSNVRCTDSGELFKSVMDTDVFDVKIGNKYLNNQNNQNNHSHSNDGNHSNMINTHGIHNSDNIDNNTDSIQNNIQNYVQINQNDVQINDNNNNDDSDVCQVVRVGVFGVCTQFTPMLSDPGSSVIFENVLEHSERCVKILKNKNCDFIIALTHMELENDKKIAEKLDINIIIGGHEHTPFYFEHSGTTIIKCGQNMDNLGILDLSFTKYFENYLNSENEIPIINENKNGHSSENINGNNVNSIDNVNNNGNIHVSIDVNIEKRGKVIVTADQHFHLYNTEGTVCDVEIDAVIKKWSDSTPEKDGEGEILCTVG